MTKHQSFLKTIAKFHDRQTRRQIFLIEAESVVPWAELVGAVEKYYPEKARSGLPYIPLNTMLRVYLMQRWFAFSDLEMEEALYEIESIRRFADLDPFEDDFPDEAMIHNFRQLLMRHHLTDQMTNVARMVGGDLAHEETGQANANRKNGLHLASWFNVPRKRNILIGSLLTLIAGWALLSPIIMKQSVEAIVNASVSTIRSPIDGLIDIEHIAPGAPVTRGQTIATASNSRVDNQLLVIIGMEIGLVSSKIEEYRSRISNLESLEANLTEQWEEFRDQRIRFLSARVKEAQSEVAAAEVERRTTKASLDRVKSLFSDGIGAKAHLEDVELDYAQASTALASKQARLERLTAERDASIDGIFAGEDLNDSPYSKQRLDEVAIQLSELRPYLGAALKRLESLRTAYTEENDRVNRLRRANLTASIQGRMWQRTVQHGEFAEKGQPIATLIACDSLVVTATVTERTFNRLNFGDPATFKLTGSGTQYDGRIIQLIGPSTRVSGLGFAISPTEDSRSEEFRVVVGLPKLSRQFAETCDIGRTGIVRFKSGSPLPTLPSIIKAVTQNQSEPRTHNDLD